MALLNDNSRKRACGVFFKVLLVLLSGVCMTSDAAAQASGRPLNFEVKSFGAACNGANDDTKAIQGALDAARKDPKANPAPRVIIPNNCVSGPLKIGSNQLVEFEEGAVLRALPGSFKDENTSFLTISGQHDVTILGHHSILAMNRDEYSSGEWRAGVFIYQSSNVKITGLKVVGAGGDGFTIKGIPPSENVDLEDVAADHCARNGISVITGRNITIRGASLTFTGPNNHGAGNHGPWAGIDIEPNNVAGEALDNIDLEDIRTSNNAGAGVQFTLHTMASTTIRLSNFHSEKDGQHGHAIGLYYGGLLFASGDNNPERPVQGQILVENANILSPNGSGVLWRNWSANQPHTILRNIHIYNPGAQTTNLNRCGLYYNVKDSSFSQKYVPGSHLNVEVDGLVVKDEKNRLIRAVWFEGDADHPIQASVKNVQEEGRPTPRVQLKVR